MCACHLLAELVNTLLQQSTKPVTIKVNIHVDNKELNAARIFYIFSGWKLFKH